MIPIAVMIPSATGRCFLEPLCALFLMGSHGLGGGAVCFHHSTTLDLIKYTVIDLHLIQYTDLFFLLLYILIAWTRLNKCCPRCLWCAITHWTLVIQSLLA